MTQWKIKKTQIGPDTYRYTVFEKIPFFQRIVFCKSKWEYKKHFKTLKHAEEYIRSKIIYPIVRSVRFYDQDGRLYYDEE